MLVSVWQMNGHYFHLPYALYLHCVMDTYIVLAILRT